MPLDFRYHLASLAAVFGALLIGILVGVAINEGPGLRKQIQVLRVEFQRDQVLRNIDQQTDQFNIRTGALLVHNRLYGRNVALVMNPSGISSATLDAVHALLAQAGANVKVEITLTPSLAELTPEQVAALYTKIGITSAQSTTVADMMRRLALDLGHGWSALTPELEGEGLIYLKGQLSTPLSTVIFLGGYSPNTQVVDQIDLPFLSGCVERQLRLAATEPLTSVKSVIPSYKTVSPLTVDNIDRAAGRIAMVLALASGQYGHYGYKQTADEVAPEME